MCRRQPYHNRCILLPLAALLTGFVALAAPSRGQVINEDLKLLAIQGETFDYFGFSIAIDNGVVAVGAYLGDDNGSDSGAAYLFNASTGAQIAQLLPIDGSGNEWFGYSIAIDNGVVAVGCRLDDVGGMDTGSAYLFNASTGAQIAKLLPSDPAALDYFGYSIAIDNGVVAVGAYYDDDNGADSGSVYLFNASGGPQIYKLLPDDGEAGDHFGQSVAIDNGVVAVGADDDDGIFPDSGSAYLFNASTGAQIHKLLPNDGQGSDHFGQSIDIDNGVVAVGAFGDTNPNGGGAGSAYLFNASTGAQIAKLLPSDGGANHQFGWSIAIDNGVVAVGSLLHGDNGTSSGSSYLFNASTGVQIVKLLPSDGAAGDRFSQSIAMDNGLVAVGAYLDDDNGPDSGSAYTLSVCLKGDIDGDGALTANLDVPALVSLLLDSTAAAQQEACAADMNSDGNIDGLDAGLFVAAIVP